MRKANARRRAGLALAALALIAAGTARAQDRTANIHGTITADETGRGLPGVRVWIAGTPHQTLTDDQGRYQLDYVRAGSVQLIAQTMHRQLGEIVVTLTAGQTRSVDFALSREMRVSEEVVVTASGEAEARLEIPATLSVVGAEKIDAQMPGHPSEIMTAVPGAWINITGGEGHMAAIRQPLTTSPVYLYLEDGIPTRSTGFFNHNALYEINVPQAGGIEVLKGPGTALYGSDAIGGVINVRTRPVPAEHEVNASFDGGSDGFARALVSSGGWFGQNGLRADVNYTRSTGWRDDTDYDRYSVGLNWTRVFDDGSSLKTFATYSHIDQQTAGSSAISEDDYLNDPEINYTPISLRAVRAFRLSANYERVGDSSHLTLTPYARHNEMRLLPNWSLTFNPQDYTTKNWSFGFLARYRHDLEPMRTRITAGVDVDHSPGDRFEQALDPTREGKIFTSYEVGDTTYDYDVTFTGLSPYVQAQFSPLERVRVTAGLRFDHLAYDYDNQLSVVETGRHRRPGSTSVDFDHVSPKLGVNFTLSPGVSAFAAYNQAFRVPSESQLFRQGQSDNTVGLDPVVANSYEVGVRGAVGERFGYEVSLYTMTKKDDILSFRHPDGSREVVNAGETSHKGIEIGLRTRPHEQLRWDLAFSYAKHEYEDWRPNSRTDYSGNEQESAPREIVNSQISWLPPALRGGHVSLEWVHLGDYFTDAANSNEYEGHDLFHARFRVPVAGGWSLFARIMNVTDELYAERVSFNAFRGQEYAPGRPRQVLAGIQMTLR